MMIKNYEKQFDGNGAEKYEIGVTDFWMKTRSLQMELINFISIKYTGEIKELKSDGICCKAEGKRKRIMKTN